jgi:hypothetical protein
MSKVPDHLKDVQPAGAHAKNSGYNELKHQGPEGIREQRYDSYSAQANQTAIRDHNRKIAEEQELIHQMRVASGEAQPVVKATWKKTGKVKGYKDEGRDTLGELVYGRK